MFSNNNIFKILLFLICFSLSISSNPKRKSFKELIDQYLGKLDINNAYLSYNQYISLLKTLQNDFPDYLELSSIGKTFEGNDMPLITMKSPYISLEQSNITKETENENITNLNTTNNINITDNNSTDNNSTDNSTSNNEINNKKEDNALFNKSGILFDGMHHGREPVSMMMNIYLILHLLSMPRSYLHLFLSSTNIYFIPIINIDTYKYNCEKHIPGTTKNMMARKNRRRDNTTKCKEEDIGVDLNRNYDYFFGKDNIGSSGRPCQEDYRGTSPFSEPETINIKNFVDSHPNIKIVLNYHTWGNLIITPFNYLKVKESNELMQKEFPIHYKMYQDFKEEGQFPVNFLFGNADETIKYLTNGDATDWFLGKKKILSFSPELGNGNKNSDVFYPNREVTFDVIEKNLFSGLYAIQKSMYYLKGQLISAEYSSCVYKNRYNYGDIYFTRGRFYQNNNLKEYELKNCLSDEMILNIKAKIINKGFGDYYPRIEFPYFQQVNNNNNETIKKIETNKKYFYFLALDLNVDLDKVKSICYWSTLQTLYTIETNNNGNNSNIKNNKEPEETQYIGKIRCVNNNNKGNELNDMKLFIDNEIKSMEYIILNLQIIVKKEKFLEKLKNKRFLETNLNNTTNANINNNNSFVKIYTKNERIIKSLRANGEIIEWKFNNPEINIKIGDFIQSKNGKNLGNTRKLNPYKTLTIIICVTFLMIFFICRMIKTVNGRPFHDLLMESINGSRMFNENNNNDMNLGMNNEQIVNNLENANQNENRNNEQIPSVQIPREDNEPQSNSNSDSPNELNA